MKLRRSAGLALMCALILAAVMPSNAAHRARFGEVREVPNEFWAIYEPYSEARAADNSQGIVTHGRRVIDFWLAGGTPQARAAQWGADVTAFGFAINSVWSVSRYVANHYEMLGDPKGALWALRVSEAFVDPYQALMRAEDRLAGNPDDLEWSRRRIQNLIGAFDVTPAVFAELMDGSGATVYHGALHEPRSGIVFGETAGGAVMDGPQRPSGLMIYVHYETDTVQERVEHDLRRLERLHGVNPEDYAFIQVGWNFIREGASLAGVPAQGAKITDAARFLYSTGLPILLRVGAEMNVWSTPADPGEFIRAFRFIANIMRREAPNVAMLWSVNAGSAQGKSREMFYPGEAYVDWVGVSLYTNKYFQGNPNTDDTTAAIWRTGRYANPVRVMRELVGQYGGRHPIIISEGGVSLLNAANNEDLTDWALPRMRQVYAYIPMLFPQVKGMFWFNVDTGRFGEPQRYHFAVSPQARALYTELTALEHFIGHGQEPVSPVTYRQLGTARMPADAVTLLTYAPFFTLDRDLRVEYRLDGRLLGSSTVIPYRQSFDLSGRPDGRHTLSVRIYAGSTNLGALTYNLVKRGARVTISAYAIPSPGDMLGNVRNTDIRVSIDGVPIMGYNIDGHTYVVAEDLTAYGFGVGWNAEARRLSIRRGESTRAPAPVPANPAPPGSIAFPYFYTDIVTYIDGRQATSYNIQGRTVIRIDDLAEAFGRISWHPRQRELRLILD